MRIVVRMLYFKAVTPSCDVLDLDDKTWRKFLYPRLYWKEEDREYEKQYRRVHLICSLLHKEDLEQYVRELAWIPLEDNMSFTIKRRLMKSNELFRALAHSVIDGDYGHFTIESGRIRIESEDEINLVIIALNGQIRISYDVKELEGRKGYSESDVDELKSLASEAAPKIAPVKILFERNGCDASLRLLLSAPCKPEEEVSDTLAKSVKMMKEAVGTVFSISQEHERQKEADMPF